MADAGYPPMSQGTPETARKGFTALTSGSVTPDQVVAVGSVEDREVAGVPCRAYLPEGDGPWPTLVFSHGGGFVIGDLDTHDQTCRRLCAGADVAVLSVGYRLAPEAPFPAAVDDVVAVTRWVLDHAADPASGLGGTDVVAVGGDSAGGNLSAVAAQELRDRLAGQVLVYPATHLAGDYPSRTDNGEGYFLDLDTMLWFAGQFVPEGADVDDPRLSPLLGDLTGLPPAVVLTAEYDPLRDEGEAYAAALRAAGVPVETHRYDGLIHGFLDMGPMSPAAAAAVDDVVARTRALLHP